jgi:uncharacterized Tic20 family protein
VSEQTTTIISSDERLLATIAHFFGLLVALIIWMLQKDKSQYVRFQSVQALAFDFVVAIFGVVFSICLMGVMFLGVAGGVFAITNSSSPEGAAPLFFMIPTLFPFVTFACIVPYSLLLLIIRAFAAGSVLTGREFRYPILGKLVENFLEHQ